MKDVARLLEKRQLNAGDVREQMYRGQHHGSGSVGMADGCWSKGGRSLKWLRLWSETLTR